MSPSDFDANLFLESAQSDSSTLDSILNYGTEESTPKTFAEAGYTGTIDYRIRQLSYSSLLTLHSCPRKFQLYKLRSSNRTEESFKSTITFAYGHIVGEGIQLVLQEFLLEDIYWKLFLSWKIDLFAEDEKLNKSFFSAMQAIKRFYAMRQEGYLSEYKLLFFRDSKGDTYNELPAIELSFAVTFPDGFRLRGFVDAVLVHRITGEILVLELKTSSAVTLNPATYKNSAQAIGYSVVIDHLYPGLSSYEVLYLVYNSKQQEYDQLKFQKTHLQKALWLRELLLDIDTIKMYEESEVYPMHGESCHNWGRECEYFQTCTLSTSLQTKPCTEKEEDVTDYQINLSLNDLLESQLERI